MRCSTEAKGENNSYTISRQAAIDVLKKAYWDEDLQAAKDDPCVIDAMTDWAIRQIKALPSAEKTGKWILNDNGTYSCSICQSWIPNEQHHYARYCLHCGTRMVNDNE